MAEILASFGARLIGLGESLVQRHQQAAAEALQQQADRLAAERAALDERIARLRGGAR